jgi:hypothetical protein
MKTKTRVPATVLATAFIAAVFRAPHCLGQSSVVYYGASSNMLDVSFIDTTLSAPARTAIVADLQVCLQEWGKNSELRLRNKEGSVGYLDIATQCPHYPENIEFPKNITNTLSGLALQIPKKLSDAYTNAFAFAAANSNVVATAYEFVSHVTSSNFFSTMTSNQISNYVLYNQAPAMVYQLGFADITNGLRYPTYYKPSVLGFYYSPVGPATNNLWLFVPGKTSLHGYSEWSPFPAIWHDGKWKFCIWEEEPHYNLPP